MARLGVMVSMTQEPSYGAKRELEPSVKESPCQRKWEAKSPGALTAREPTGQERLDLGLDDDDAGGGSSRSGLITGKRSALLWHVLSSVYDRLGFDVVDDDAFKELVLARIIEPTSACSR